jgi:predicted small lipoprotein YifL
MRKLIIALAIAASLPACGLKGSLYLPQQKPGANTPAPANSEPADEKKTTGTAAP